MAEQSTAMVVLGIAGALAVGIVLGLAYLWGLWYTIRRQASVGNPGLWMLVSLLARLTLLLGGFYLVGAGSWQRLLACLAGFALARLIMTRHLRPHSPPAAGPAPGKGAAP